MCEQYGNEICIHPLDFALFARYLNTLVPLVFIYMDAVDILEINARPSMSHELLNIGTHNVYIHKS